MACTSQSAVEYIMRARTRLVGGLQNISIIVENLFCKKVLSPEDVSNIKADRNDFEKTRTILDLVTKKGEKPSYELLKVIYLTRTRTLKTLESQEVGSNQESTFDLHHWISCFSFKDDVEMDSNYYKGDDLHLSEMRIILLGYKCSGKSSSGNTILGTEEFSLEKTAQCEKRQGDVAGRQVTVIDTPGWWWLNPLKRTSELIKQEIVLSVSLCPLGPHVLLLVIEADDACGADTCKYIEEHMQLLSQRVWSHTIILFTCGDYLGGRSIEQYIESEGKALQRLVEKCGNMYHVFNNENRGDDAQVTELLLKIEEMVARNEGRHY